MVFRHHLWLLAVAALAACTQFPELEGTVRPELRDAPYPALVPLEPILASVPPATVDPVEVADGLEARRAALRNRANAIRGAVIDPAARNRLDEGVTAR
jgi:hypothetical protein